MKNKNRLKIIVIGALLILLTACNHDGGGETATGPTPPSFGTVTGSVRDAALNAGLSDVTVLVRDENDAEVESTTTDANGNYEIRVPANQQYQFIFTLATHYQSVYSGVSVNADETENLEVVLQIDTTIVGAGSFSGTLIDAFTGRPAASAQIFLRAGINAHTGDIVAETMTDSIGNYVLLDTLQTGQYTMEILLDGYVDAYATILVLGGQLISNQNASITPVLVAGETRIVLTWGLTPADLDSHLTGPDANNSSTRFHVYFGNKGSATAFPFARLDVDDIFSYGPETVTISSQFQGVYRYYVHDFSNGSNTNSPALGNSSAKVTVYQGSQQPRVFNVPSGVGTTWQVFELNGGNLRPVNTLSRDATFRFAGAARAGDPSQFAEVQDEIRMIKNASSK